jgi:hypothetical protein
MAKHNSVTLGFDDCARKTIPVVAPVRGGVKSKLSRWATMLIGYIGGRRRRPVMDSYIPRTSRKEESRLEFKDSCTGSPIKEIEVTAEAQRTWS